MTPEIISLAFGVLLILIGILGGGFEVRKLKIPKVGPAARILAAVGGLTVNEPYPRSTITVTVPQEGKYNDVLDTSAVFKGDNAELHGVGQGTIDVKSEKAFTARGCVSGNRWIATLMEGSR